MNRMPMFYAGQVWPELATAAAADAADGTPAMPGVEQPRMILDGRRLPEQEQPGGQPAAEAPRDAPEVDDPSSRNGNAGSIRSVFMSQGWERRRRRSAASLDTGPSSLSSILQSLNQSQELSGFFNAVERYVPFMFIAAAKIFLDHSEAIFVFAALMLTFYHANSVIRREVARKSRRSLHPVLAVLLNVSACIVFIRYVVGEDNLLYLTVFVKTGKVETFAELLWIVAINDFALKFVAVAVKIFVVLLPASLIRHRKRGNVFLFIEVTNQLYRSLVPIHVWLTYLMEGGAGASEQRVLSKVVRVVLTAIYIVIKGKLILNDVTAWKFAVARLWQSTRYGVVPTSDEAKAHGDLCPICHDQLTEPTRLHCRHIFCEECLSLWFDRERTCPMCRAQVAEDPSWKDGATSQFIQLY